MHTFPCPSGCGKDCPHPSECVDACQFQVAEKPVYLRRPAQFQPDYGITYHRARPWYTRAPSISTFAKLSGGLIVAVWVALFVWRAFRNF